MVKIDFPVFNTLAQTKSKQNKVKNSFSQYSKYISYLGYVLMILYRFGFHFWSGVQFVFHHEGVDAHERM